MGLDATFYRKQFVDSDNYDLEYPLIYFRKFYGLDTWINNNCEKLQHDIIDVKIITKSDMENIRIAIKNKDFSEIDINWEEENEGKMSAFEEFLDFEYEKGFDDEYYYEYFN